MLIDRLIEKIIELKNPSVVGLDTNFDYLPDDMKEGVTSLKEASEKVVLFNKKIIDSIYDIVPAVKVQVAYYEMLGVYGIQAFKETLDYANEKGMITIADVKRNDIGSTASCYSQAFLSGISINGEKFKPFEADMITVNPYLGSDGIVPFVKDCEVCDKGIFILDKNSNPSSGELQDLKYENGNTLYEQVGDLIAEWGKSLIGKYGYSSIGAVVGATHKEQAEKLRKRLKNVFFLIPGYGAQGGTAEDLAVCFDENGLGGIVNSSRGILCAYKKEKFNGKPYNECARQACIEMRDDIVKVINLK